MHKPVPTGQVLLANFQTVFVSQATIEAAHNEANRSESELLTHLQNVSSGNYLQPGALGSYDQDSVTKASLDAHIKKVQASQLDSMNAQQLYELQKLSQADYKGRKVQVTVRMPSKQPVETVWFDQRYGFRTSASKKKQYSGVIEEIILNKNLLILRPNVGSRLLNSSLQNYAVYVIDPVSLQPMIDITIR